MQLLANGRDQVAESYAEGPIVLHRLVDGTYQFGVGKDASVVSSVEQVKKFSESIQAKVAQWLESGGYERGMQAKQNLDLAESSRSMPGSIEALLMQVGGQDLMGKFHALLKNVATGKAPDLPVPTDVKRPDQSVKDVIVVDEEDEDEGLPAASPLPVIPGPITADEEAAFLATTPASMGPAPNPDLMVAMTGLAEGMSAIMARLEALEQKPKAASAPKKRVRPSRAKATAAPKPAGKAPAEAHPQ